MPYRVRQWCSGLRTAVEPADALVVRELLTPRELRLFLVQRPRDRRHAVLTMRAVERMALGAGREPSPELRKAALLHDVGKGAVRSRERVAYVVTSALWPRLLGQITREPPGGPQGDGWRAALWRLDQHPALGAVQLAAAGAEARVVWLTLAHHRERDAAADRELGWLAAADEAV